MERAWPPLLAASLAALVTGCTSHPPSAQELAAQRAATVAENARRVAAAADAGTNASADGTNAAVDAGSGTDAGTSAWSFTVSGQLGGRAPRTFSLADIHAMPATDVRAVNNGRIPGGKPFATFRGVRVSTLLDAAGVDPAVTDLAFVAFDAYRSSVKVADARHAPIIVAYEADGIPLTRPTGGPLSLVFPSLEDATIAAAYPSVRWAFYLTGAIAGVEPTTLRIGTVTLDDAALRALPPETHTVKPRYRVGWPSGAVTLTGARLADVLRAAHVSVGDLPPQASLVFYGKPPVSREPQSRWQLDRATLDTCDPLVAYGWTTRPGASATPIPPSLGGPLTVAVSDDCPGHEHDVFWPTFLEEIVVAP